MKQLCILFSAFFFCATIIQAQSLDDAKKQIYYERHETAKSELKSLIAKGDASPEAYYWLGEVYLEEGDVDSAKNLLEGKPAQFLQQGVSMKKNPLVFVGWAHVLLDEGKTVEARQEMQKIIDAGKNKDAEALWAIGKANVDSKYGDSTWAIQVLQRATERDKKNPQIFTTLGDAYRRLIDGSNAIINYDKAINADDNYAAAMYKKGRIYKTQKNPEIYVDRFKKAVDMDSNYAPALYELYYYYYFLDVNTADKYLQAYIRHSEASPDHAYMLADLHYVSKKYQQAIDEAKAIIANRGEDVEPRMYKLVAYSYAALGDSSTALKSMNTYFQKQDDTSFVSKDYELKAKLLEKLHPEDKTEPIDLLRHAVAIEQDTSIKIQYFESLANMQKELGNRDREAFWRGRLYLTDPKATNLDLYKWGMARYSAKDYKGADSVFAIYQDKYPDQLHGYLWRARANGLIDTTMQLGLAVPHYKALVTVAATDSVKNEKVLLTAYEYLGAYEANVGKDFVAAKDYFTKILQLDPENADAANNVKLLTKWIEDAEKSGTKEAETKDEKFSN